MRSFKKISELRGNGSRIFPDRHFNPRKRTLPIFQLSVAIEVRAKKKANSARENLSCAESQFMMEPMRRRRAPYRANEEMINCMGISN
jgi:hypothetical protein